MASLILVQTYIYIKQQKFTNSQQPADEGHRHVNQHNTKCRATLA
jgi:hypothetical protein